MTSIKIIVPVHEEPGWTASSPDAGASVKARLQAKSPKSPEALKRIEERGAQLHELHLEATQQIAAKHNQRAKDVVAARLRRAASSRQNLLSRFEAQSSHRDHSPHATAPGTGLLLTRLSAAVDRSRRSSASSSSDWSSGSACARAVPRRCMPRSCSPNPNPNPYPNPNPNPNQVHAARAAAQADKEHRAAVIRSREEACARQAEKAREQMEP
eukprot:scaffold92490_cov60-Phaeocystis_antarctica.AAC.2